MVIWVGMGDGCWERFVGVGRNVEIVSRGEG